MHTQSATTLRRGEEFRQLFKSIFSKDADEVLVNRCFFQLWDTYLTRRFPDITYLEDVLDGLNLSDRGVPTRTLLLAAWYQHSANGLFVEETVQRGVDRAKEDLPLLKVSKADVKAVVSLIRSTATTGIPLGSEALWLADANTYARYGKSYSRTNEIIVLRVEQDDIDHEHVRGVISEELLSVQNGTVYYSCMMHQLFNTQSRSNIFETLKNLNYLGRNNPKLRKLE